MSNYSISNLSVEVIHHIFNDLDALTRVRRFQNKMKPNRNLFFLIFTDRNRRTLFMGNSIFQIEKTVKLPNIRQYY